MIRCFILLLTIFVLSCNKETKDQKKTTESTIKNFSLSGLKNNEKGFELKAQKANINGNIIVIKDVSFIFYEKSQLQHLIKSKIGNYDKDNKILNLSENEALLVKNKFQLKSKELSFFEKENYLKGEQITLNFHKNNIIANSFESKSGFSKITLKKVFAKLSY